MPLLGKTVLAKYGNLGEKSLWNSLTLELNSSIPFIIISLSCHEQVCLSGLRFERYFSHHRARHDRARHVHDMINLL